MAQIDNQMRQSGKGNNKTAIFTEKCEGRETSGTMGSNFDNY